jgi:hypothetical protein
MLQLGRNRAAWQRLCFSNPALCTDATPLWLLIWPLICLAPADAAGPPETPWAGEYLPASDVFSFGVVLLELLTGLCAGVARVLYGRCTGFSQPCLRDPACLAARALPLLCTSCMPACHRDCTGFFHELCTGITPACSVYWLYTDLFDRLGGRPVDPPPLEPTSLSWT